MARNPYCVEGHPPLLRRSVFVFMDILGFSQMIRASQAEGSHQQLLQKLHAALTKGRRWLEEKDLEGSRIGKAPDDYALKAFTDNIVIGWPIRDDGEMEIGSAFMKLDRFQLEMALEGFFLRGAISLGDAYVDEIAVFGGALLDAHDAEATLARDPRIILTPSAVEAVQKHLNYYGSPKNAPQSRALLRDSDGQVFLNYLDNVLCAEDECGPFFESLLGHKAAVELRLEQFSTVPTVWSKYAWVARYHNAFCDLHPEYFDREHRIDVSLFERAPTLIA